MTDNNRRIVLASRPVGAPTQDNFRLETVAVPSIKEGEVLLRSIYLSLDPYMRGRMNDAKSYAEPVAIDEVMVGATVCQVEQSQHSDYQVGEWVLAYTGWQDYGVSNGEGLVKLGMEPSHPSFALGIMGMPGFTAYMGLLDIGQPKEGDTLVVAAATGPVGATVGQIGKLKGCRVIGVAGGEEKCRHAKEVLGFDECTEHPTKNSQVTVHYHGTLIDGTVFDSSVERGEPITFALKQVIKGWQEGLTYMVEGQKVRLFIPSTLGYGKGGTGPIPPSATLIFDVELLSIK